MKKLTSRLTALILTATILCCMVPLASAVPLAPLVLPGWEGWTVERFQVAEEYAPEIYLTCPNPGATDAEMTYYAGKLMSEIAATGLKYVLFFPQPSWNEADFQSWFSRNGGAYSRRMLFGTTHMEFRRYYENGSARVVVSPASTTMPMPIEAAIKVNEVGAEVKAAADTVRGQLEHINNWLCDNVQYDYEGDTKENEGAYNIFIFGEGVCNDYMVAVSLLCDYLGIPNLEVHGVNHAWNIVYVDGAWKHLDVTWNDAATNRQRYFLVDDIIDKDGQNAHQYNREWVEKRKANALAVWDELMTPLQSANAVTDLANRGILRGDQSGNLNLGVGLTRAELAAVLTRMNGAEEAVMSEQTRYSALCTFTDVPDWAKPYVGYCVEQGLVTGYNPETYGAADPVTPAALCTVVLRFMGYPETDWNYNTAVSKAASTGLVSPFWPTGTVALRNDIANLVHAALTPAK